MDEVIANGSNVNAIATSFGIPKVLRDESIKQDSVKVLSTHMNIHQ
jgi:hypothetical protein